MAPANSPNISEHWLTTCTCTVCEKSPENTPVYACNLGHPLCLNCFRNMTRNGMPQCIKCQSTKFRIKQVSDDFLKKLLVKPGIGRPRRYPVSPSRSTSASSSEYEMKHRDETITMEKLFQLPTDKLQEIFEEANRRKMALQQGAPPPCRCCNIGKGNHLNNLNNYECTVKKPNYSKPPMKEIQSSTSMCSRKPLNCPHKPCSKIIAMSSFHTHFKHEHTDIPRYAVDRGKELEIVLDSTVLEYNASFCLGILTLYEISKLNISRSCSTSAANVAKKFDNQRISVDKFWVMASGSSESKKSHAYIMFWLLATTDDFYNCTIELSSEEDQTCYSTFCGINSMHESYSIKDVAQRLNCLYLTYGTMETILSLGSKPKLRVTIH